MNQDVRRITDGASMLALGGLMLFMNRQTGGLMEAYFLWLIPIPFAFFTSKYGFKEGILPVVSMMLLSLVLGSSQSMFYFSSMSVCGLVYGHGIHKKWKVSRLLLTTIVTSIAVNVITTVLLATFFGYDILKEMELVKTSLQPLLDSNEAMKQLDFDAMLQVMMIVSPLLIGVLEGTVTHLFSMLILKKLKVEVPVMQPITSIRPNKWLAYSSLLLIFVGARVVAEYKDNRLLFQLYVLVNIVCFLYLCFFGMIAIIIWSHKTNNKRVPMFVAIGCIFIPYLLYFLIILGFLYSTSDLKNYLLGEMNGRDKQA